MNKARKRFGVSPGQPKFETIRQAQYYLIRHHDEYIGHECAIYEGFKKRCRYRYIEEIQQLVRIKD